jgi:hypothetical protein
MIIRPEAEADLLALIAAILSDTEIPIDARAMLATLIARRDIRNCPVRAKLAGLIGAGPYRVGTIIGAAIASGYMRRAAGAR